MPKSIFSISAFCIVTLLFACGIASKKEESISSWATEFCDTTQRLEKLQIIDLVLPFSQTDTLKYLLVKVPKVFVAITENGQVIQSSAITAATF